MGFLKLVKMANLAKVKLDLSLGVFHCATDYLVTGRLSLPDNLYCVGGDVKPCSIQATDYQLDACGGGRSRGARFISRLS